MASKTKPTQPRERPSEAYQNLFSIAYYEYVIEAAVETVLEHGRQLVGLAPLGRDVPLTNERRDLEFETAEPFVAARLARTGMGFITMVLSEDEWSVIADSSQRPHREPTPLHEHPIYNRQKSAARAKVQIASASAPSVSSSVSSTPSANGGAKTRRVVRS
jgi:hypothetical protein